LNCQLKTDFQLSLVSFSIRSAGRRIVIVQAAAVTSATRGIFQGEPPGGGIGGAHGVSVGILAATSRYVGVRKAEIALASATRVVGVLSKHNCREHDKNEDVETHEVWCKWLGAWRRFENDAL
jgi:hypothetical protein